MALFPEEHEAAQKEHALQKKRDKNLKVKMPKSPTASTRSDRERPGGAAVTRRYHRLLAGH